MALLVDLADCCDDHALEDLIKARVERPDALLWDPLENRWGRALVETVTARFQDRLLAMQNALASAMGGTPGLLHKADAPWVRIDDARLEQIRNRLESTAPELMTAEDYQLLIEYLVQRYLPDDFAMSEAEFIAVRGTLLGKFQAALEHDHRVTDTLIDALALILPTQFIHVPPRVLTSMEAEILQYGRLHAGEMIRDVTERTRHQMAIMAMEHVQGQLLGQKEGTWAALQTRLFDAFSRLNRDFRRIAITETGEVINQGYCTTCIGHRVKRIEAYRYACDFCKSINGKIFVVVSPDKPDKDWDTEVWSGKTNFGRSASPFKREGDTLVPRTKDEMWAPAAGLQHPNCRGSWIKVTNRPLDVSPEFFNYVQAQLDAVKVPAE